MSQDWEWDVFLLSDKKHEQYGYDPIYKNDPIGVISPRYDPIYKNMYIQMFIWNV